MRTKRYKGLIIGLIGALLLNTMYVPGSSVQAKSNDTSVKKYYSEDRIIVKFKSNANTEDKKKLKNKLGLETSRELNLTKGELLKVKDKNKIKDIISALKKEPSVEYAEPDYLIKPNLIPNDPSFGKLWGLQNSSDIDIDAPEAWDITLGSADVVVGVIDEGIDISHPDIAANIWTNPGEIPGDGIDNDGNGYIDDMHGWDFYHNDNTVFDAVYSDDHGTHVAGTIAAISNNGIGVAGVAPKVRVMPLKFMDSGSGYTSDAVDALEYAQKMGIKLVNASWGSTYGSTTLKEAINNFKGVFVAAAGNDGVNNDLSPHYPSAFDCPNIISVAAVDSLGALASFSNYGVNSVDVAAPGVSIYSLMPGSSYGYMSGTSMATPHVTGEAALLLSVNPYLTPQQVCDLVKQTTVPLNSLQGKTARGGIVKAYSAVKLAATGPHVTSADPADNSKEVPLDKLLKLVFNEPIQPGINFGSIALNCESSKVQSEVVIDGNTMLIKPSVLSNDKNYTLVLPKESVTNVNGEAIPYTYTLSFATPDTIAPYVMSTYPTGDSLNADTYEALAIKFSEQIKDTIEFSKILINGQPLISGQNSWRVSGDTLFINHYPFLSGTKYTVTIPENTVSDLKGNLLTVPYSFSFTTAPDTTAPYIKYNSPADGDVEVSNANPVRIMFSEEMKEGINFSDITVTSNNVPVSINKVLEGLTLYLKPVTAFDKGTTYKVTIPNGSVTDLSGNSVGSDYSFSFTTSIYDMMNIPYYVVDAMGDSVEPVIYGADIYGTIFKLNYETRQSQELKLPYTLRCIDIGQGADSNSLYVAMSQAGSNQEYIGVINKSDMTLKNTFPVELPVYDLVAGRDGFIYITSGSGQWTSILSYDPVTGIKKSSSGIRQMSYAKLHPAFDRIYTIDTDLSPRDYNAYNISNGVFTDPTYPGGYDSPYHGDYQLFPAFAIDPTGKYLFNGSGTIFAAAQNRVDDMKYVGKLPGGFTDIAFEKDLSSIYTASNNSTSLEIYNGIDFSLQQSIKLPAYGRKIFKNNKNLVVLLESTTESNGPSTQIEIVPIQYKAPAVLSASPTSGSTNVPANSSIKITFSKNVYSTASFDGITLKDSLGNAVYTVKTLIGNVLTITPGPLNYSTTYTLDIPASAVVDIAGSNLDAPFNMSFTTQAEPDTTAPVIIGTDPKNGAEGVTLDKSIDLTFSEPVISGNNLVNVVLKDSNNNIVKTTVSFSTEGVLHIVPERLSERTKYTLSVPAGAVFDRSGNALAAPYTSNFSTWPANDGTVPSITSCDPAGGDVNVPINKAITLGFSENILSANINGIVLTDSNSNIVSTQITAGSNTLQIVPAKLNYNTKYTLTVPSGAVSDLCGNLLVNSSTFSFTTQLPPDTAPPLVVSSDPSSGAVNVPVNKTITLTFNENIVKDANFDGITLKDATSNIVVVDATVVANTLQIVPAKLSYNAKYTLTVPSGAISDLSGNLFGNTSTFSFTTQLPPDTTAPTIVSTTPAANSYNVSRSSKIVITFSENIQLGSTSGNITISLYGRPVTCSKTVNGNQLIIDAGYLSRKSTYTVNLPSGAVIDAAGNAITSSYSFSFTTVNK